ncbi:MAG: hypothetical protein P8X73_08765 [Ignavibacteriaceae bacterium]|jgi:hypothetical protein
MNLIKQYIVQSLTAASNNLRLTTHQLEAVGLLRESLLNSDDILTDIDKMKKLTELSTLAIRLNEIYNFLTQRRIDFFKLSEQFKEHSQYLITDLNHILEGDNSVLVKNALNRLSGVKTIADEEININLTQNKTNSDLLISTPSAEFKRNTFISKKKAGNGHISNFEMIILDPIKPIDRMLRQMEINDVNPKDLAYFAKVMRVNAEISEKQGYEIVAEMHLIISRALLMIKSSELLPGKNIIESIQACLIVIVALVRGKDLDITNYLNKAEDFGEEISLMTNKV